MTKIIYKHVRLADGKQHYLPTEIHGTGGELVLEFRGAEGRCKIGDRIYRLRGGSCCPETGELCGSITPILISGEGACECGRFDIIDGRATLPQPTREELAAALACLEDIRERLSYLEGEVCRHEALISGTPLFKFD